MTAAQPRPTAPGSSASRPSGSSSPTTTSAARADHAAVRAALTDQPLPGGSALTWEPGGQIELSTPPLDGPGAACAALAADLDVVRDRLASTGHTLVGTGLDPHRTPTRILDTRALPRHGGVLRRRRAPMGAG